MANSWVRREYQLSFSPKKRGKSGPKGPSPELIRAIVELKRRNPRFGCPRIASIIARTFDLEIDKDVEEIKTVPGIPWSHPFVERLIGTIRREFLDQTLFWNSVDLESKLLAFRNYYNQERVHSGIGGDTPDEVGRRRPAKQADLGGYRWQTHCRGLYQLPIAA